MELVFEKGDALEPRGHALVYFRNNTGTKPLATYVVVVPVKVDFAKYVPPMLAAQIEGMGVKEFHAFALPPVPEEVESATYLQRLAEMRGDDLLQAGSITLSDVGGALQSVNAVVQEYSRRYAEYSQGAVADAAAPSVSETLYELISSHDRLIELSKFVGKLRFAVEGKDRQQAKEVEEEIRTLAKYLPESYHTQNLLEAARTPTELGEKLAQLYLERCYKLNQGDLAGVMEIEQRVKKLKDDATPGAQ